jgi:copper chaperone NosL
VNKMIRFTANIIAAASLWLLTGCSDPVSTGPEEVRWDREPCTRCVMSISDPNFAAQVRGAPEGEPQLLSKFDDLGCAIIWLGQQSWKDNPQVEIWVSAYQGGDWIDARQAYFVQNQLTPMNYGLGAQKEEAPGALNFTQARAHILKIEEELNLHGGNTHLSMPSMSMPAKKS